MKNTLYFEDCKEVLRRLPDNSIDAFIQDPPFEVTSQSWDVGFIESLPELWHLWLQKAKKNAVFVFKATFPFAIDLINSNRKMFKYEWLWKKNRLTNFVNAKRMPLRCVEYIFVFYAEQPTYNPVLRKTKNPQKKAREKKNSNTKIYNINNGSVFYSIPEYGQPVNLIEVPSEKEAFISNKGQQNRHPNRTNPKVWEYFLRTYTNEGDVIFDGYTGSGSVPEACINLNRNFIACENSEEYFPSTEKSLLKKMEVKKYGFPKTEITQSPTSLFYGLA